MKTEILTSLIFGVAYLMFIYLVRKTETFDSFAVGDRKIKGFYIFASLSATIVGPGFSLGFASEGFNSGILYGVLGIFYGLQMILVGNYVVPKIKLKFSNAFSLGDIIAGENSHNNRVLKISSGVISVCVCIGVVAVLAKAGGDIFNVLLEIPAYLGGILMTLIVILYSFFGGIKASIFTDTFQFIMFLILIPSLFFLVIYSSDIDKSVFLEVVVTTTNEGLNLHSLSTIFGLIAWFIFGDILQPPILNRILASSSISTSKRAFISAGVFCFAWLILMSLLGVVSKIIFVDVDNSDQILLLLGKEYYSPFLFGVFIVAMLGIVMSSQDSILNAGSTVFTRDLLEPLLIRNVISNNLRINSSRIATICIGVLGIIISFLIPSILDGLLFLASIWAPTMIVSILSSIFLTKIYWQSAFISMFLGLLTSISWTLSKYSDIIPSILVGILLSFIGYWISHKYFKSKHLS